MKLYVITADTEEDLDMNFIELFGIFSDIERANERKDELEYPAHVDEVSLDENCEIYLGGFINRF